MAVERTHEEIQDLLGAYALDATDADETAMIDAHLASCPWCSEELRQHREVAAVLAGGMEVAPPDVWSRIVDQLEGDEAPSLPAPRPLGRSASDGDGRASDRAGRRSGWARPLLVAAAVVVVLGVVGALLGVVAHQQSQIDDLDRAVNTTTTTVTAPATKTVSLVDDQSEPVGKVVIGSDGTARFVDAEGMESLDADHVYQLWGVVGEDKISLAVLDSDPTMATFTVPDQVTTLAVTEERSPGVVSSVQPAVAAGPVV